LSLANVAPESEPLISEKRRIVRNTLANASVQVLQLASSFVFMPFLIRSFGLAEYGVFILAGSLSAYLGLLDFGVGTTVMKYVAEYRATHQEDRLGSLVSNVMFYYGAVGVVAASFLFLFSRFGIGVFHLDPAGAQLAGRLFLASAVIALFNWPLMVGGAVVNGLQRYDLSARVGIGVVFANVLVIGLVLLTHEGPLMLLAAQGLVSVGGGAAYSLVGRSLIAGAPVSLRLVSWGTLREVFRFSSAVFVMQIASLIVYQQTDRLVIGIFVGAAAVALYEAASKVQGLVTQLAGMPIAALMPAASQLGAEERDDTLRELFLRGTKYTAMFVLPVVVTLFVLARPLLQAWLGPVFAAQSLNAQLFISYWLLWVNLLVPINILIGTSRIRFVMWFSIVQAGLNLLLSLVLVRMFGVRGVILGTVISNVVIFPVGMRYALRVLGVSAGRWLRRVVLPVYSLLAVPVLAGIGLTALGLTRSLAGVAAAGVISVLVYWAAVYAIGLEAAEREDAQAFLRSALARLGLGRAA
jgi:O-antigen/teichoic acid export membrane protein